MRPFVGNDYRKRVLAAVEKRGGVTESDPFELYDLSLEDAEALTDAEVAARIDEVWAFWQKHRDHPKYRVLVEQLVAEHAERSEPLRTGASRSAEARGIADRRRRRDEDRFALLDNAIERLVGRHGGIPAGKRAGLDEIGAMGGLTADEVATRVRRHRIIDDAAAGPAPSVPALSPHKLSQIDELLAEFSRRSSGPATHTLLAVLDLDTDAIADRREISMRAGGLRSRSRELPAGRMRALVDELLIHVDDVLLGPEDVSEAYLRAVRDSVSAHLRPRIRAAILVEDRLDPDDHQYMLDEARELGLGTRDARALIDTITTELGGEVAPGPRPDPGRTTASAPPAPRTSPGSDWQRSLRSARQALRKGNLDDARARCEQARQAAGDDDAARRQIGAVDDEITRVLTAGVPAPTASAPTASVPTASVPTAPAIATAPSGAAPAAVAAPTDVHATVTDGAVRVQWMPAPAPGAQYRVTRIDRSGRRQVVGRTATTEIEDGGARPTEGLPTYEVTAVVGGVQSAPARSDSAPVPARTPTPRPSRPAPVGRPRPVGMRTTTDLPAITDVAVTGGRLTFTWPAGITEVVVVIRPDAPPDGPMDRSSDVKKVTNTRYEIDGGYPIPESTARGAHIAVAACRRISSEDLAVAADFGPHARTRL